MKQTNYHIYLTEQESSQVIQALIELKNNLTVQGRYTDAAQMSSLSFKKLEKNA